jgi:uncharacterized protein with ParB-like and HNH nuclease domain
MVLDMKQALDIFLKINIRGKQLEGSDYLKNYLFRNLGPGYDFETLADTWEKMSANLRSSTTKREKLKTPEFFLRNWALLLKGEKVGGDNAVFEFWETRFDSDQNKYIREFLNTVQVQSKNFSRISSNKYIENLCYLAQPNYKTTTIYQSWLTSVTYFTSCLKSEPRILSP